MSERTKDEVRRAIAEALGWKIEAFHNDQWIITHNGSVCFKGKAWKYRKSVETRLFKSIPDWPSDPGAALELLTSIILERGGLVLTISRFRGVVAYDFATPGERPFASFASGNAAFDLARLALAALEARAVTHD
jgi:hypothetical protein